MKKLTMIAVFALMLFGFSSMASASDISSDRDKPEKPKCEIGYTFKGELVAKKVCDEPCLWCVSIRPVCRIIWTWEGECIKNGSIVPPTPIIKPIYTDGLMGVLNAQCKDDQIIWSEWSKCDWRFGKQFRYAERNNNDYGTSKFNGCFITGLQQSTSERLCE